MSEEDLRGLEVQTSPLKTFCHPDVLSSVRIVCTRFRCDTFDSLDWSKHRHHEITILGNYLQNCALQMTESLLSPLNKQFPNLRSAGLPPDSDLSSMKPLITILTDLSVAVCAARELSFCISTSRHTTVWAGTRRCVSDLHHKGLNWALKLSVCVWMRRVRSPCWKQEGVKRRAIITAWRGTRWLATRLAPHWPPVKTALTVWD